MPSIALWMLVAVADVAILVAAGGLLVTLLVVAALVVVAGGVVAARLLAQRTPAPVPVRQRPVEAQARRRA
jgi:hypothetical protein